MINEIESNKCIELQSKCNYLKHFSFSKVTPTVNRVTLVLICFSFIFLWQLLCFCQWLRKAALLKPSVLIKCPDSFPFYILFRLSEFWCRSFLLHSTIFPSQTQLLRRPQNDEKPENIDHNVKFGYKDFRPMRLWFSCRFKKHILLITN